MLKSQLFAPRAFTRYPEVIHASGRAMSSGCYVGFLDFIPQRGLLRLLSAAEFLQRLPRL
jgi:hypothetical protein